MSIVICPRSLVDIRGKSRPSPRRTARARRKYLQPVVKELESRALLSQLADPGFAIASVGTGPAAFVYDPAGSPWTFSGAAGVAGNNSNFTGGNPNSPSGSQVAFLQGTGSISQSVNLAAGTYVVSFQASQRGNFNSGGQTIKVIVNNMPVGTVITPASSSYATYTTSATFTVAAGTATITLQGTDPSGGDNTAFVANVMTLAPPNVSDPGFTTSFVGSGPAAFVYDPAGSPWTFSGAAGVAGNNSNFTGGNPNSPSGSQVAFLQGTGSISQSVNLAAGTYVVSFQAAQRGNFNSGGQTIKVIVNNMPVGTVITPASSSYATYTTSTTFTVAAGTAAITLQATDPSGGDNTAFVTNVMILAPPNVSDPGFTVSSVSSGPSAFQYDPANSPWTYTGAAGVAGNNSNFTGGNPDSPSGSAVAFLQGTGSISQSVNLAAGTYVVSFQAAQRGNFNSGGQTIKVIVNNMPVGTVITPASSSYATYTTSTTFTVAAGTAAITLQATDPSGGDNTAFVTNVMILAPPNVSDPGFTMSSMGSGPSAYQYDPADSPWTFTGAAGVAGNNSNFTGGNPDSPSGSDVAFLQGTGSISQSLELAAGSYVVSFQASQRGNFNSGGQTIKVIVNNMPVGAVITPASSSYPSYTTSTTFTVGEGMATITLQGTDPSGGDNTAFLTNVMILAESSS